MVNRRDAIGLGDLLQAYSELDEGGRLVFRCAFLHVWARYSPRAFGRAAARTGGPYEALGGEALRSPVCAIFGDALELPMPGIFER